jgi:transposase-like protein
VSAETNKRWSDTQKIEAVTTYLMLGGNLSQTSKALKIPLQTLNVWKYSEWWNHLERDVRKEERLTLSTKLKKVMDLSLEVASDRLERGDWIYDQKAGELRRKPVSMRDASKLAMDAANLRTKMDLNENHTIANEEISSKLEKLAEAFTNLSKGIKVTQEEVEDIEFVEEVIDALHEERSEGLQT